MQPAGIFPLLALVLSLPVAARADAIDDYVQAEMEEQHIPGATLAIVTNGVLAKTAAYGLANVELNVPARVDTVFQIQSVTKTFTAAGILMLVEEGKVGLDDKITRYLDRLPESWSEITVRQLLTHTSGIKDYINEPTVNMRLDLKPEEVIRSLDKLPLNFSPGEKYAYCNTGYHLLGMIIHKVTGKSWDDFVRERILEPLDMRDTRVISWADLIPNRASGYLWVGGELKNGNFIAPTILGYAGGGFRSTVLDLARWDAALYSEKILNRATLEQAWTPATLNDGSKSGYGFGWGINDCHGRRLVSHTGSHMTGFKSVLMRYPEDQLTVILLTNSRNADQRKIAHGVVERFLPSHRAAEKDAITPAAR